MKSTLLFRTLGAGLVLLLLVAGLGYVSIGHLKHNAEVIVDDTLPGLAYAGEANAYLADASRTLLLLITEDSDHRLHLQEEINNLSKRTTGFLEKYEAQIHSSEDQTNFNTLRDERTKYIAIRNEVINLANAGNKPGAMSKYTEELLPAHKRVKVAGEKLLQYNMHQADLRGRSIMNSCTITQIAVAAGSVLLFIAGFFIGLFK